MKNINKAFLLSISFLLLIPASYSDGGCVKVADDVFLQLSSAPVAPRAARQASYLFSFGDKNGLISKDINGTLRITKDSRTIFSRDFLTSSGILDMKYTYESPGLYEIFFDFSIGGKNYKPEDFLIEAVDEENFDKKNDFAGKIIFFAVGIAIGATSVKLINIRNRKLKK